MKAQKTKSDSTKLDVKYLEQLGVTPDRKGMPHWVLRGAQRTQKETLPVLGWKLLFLFHKGLLRSFSVLEGSTYYYIKNISHIL